MKAGTTLPGQPPKSSLASNLDTSTNMAKFLKDIKILSELGKGVQSMKTFVYPSVLQKEAIPVLKKAKSTNIIIRYSMMSGVKLTVLLPTLNQLIRQVVTTVFDEKSQTQYLLLLCHSSLRCSELEGFTKELTHFCSDVIDVIGAYSQDTQENVLQIKQSLQYDKKDGTKGLYKARCKVIITTPNQFRELMKKDVLKQAQCSSLIVDKVDMHIALDLTSDLEEVAKMNLNPTFRTIITTNFKDEQKGSTQEEESFQALKKAFMGEAKALIIQVNEDHRIKSKFERVEHFYVLTQTNLDKFVLLFTFIKLGILDGKTVIYTNDIIQAYRIKLFLSKFQLKAFVLSPELPKNQAKSLIHFFHIGQFNIMIVLQSGYSQAPQFKNVQNIVNFDAPEKYNQYKEAGQHIEYDNGSELTFIQPQEDKEKLELYQRKMMKAFSRESMIKCIPIIWQELLKIKSRVEDVVKTLDNKKVKDEKTNEFKKQLLSNQRLKEYFNKHPDEKEILLNDIQKTDTSQKDRFLFKHLGFLPSYVLPSQVIAVTDEQIRMCTVGTGNLLSGSLQGSLARDKTVAGQVGGYQAFADPTECQSSLIQNLASLPATIERYQLSQAGETKDDTFAYEDPSLVNAEALEPTSGRKLWKLRHHKRIKKKLKPFKNGFIGS